MPKENEVLGGGGHIANKWQIQNSNSSLSDFKIPVLCMIGGCSNHRLISAPCLEKYLYAN